MEDLNINLLTLLIQFGLGVLTLVATVAVTTIPGHLKQLLIEVAKVGNRVNVLSKQLEMIDANLDAIRTQVVEMKKAAAEIRGIQPYTFNRTTNGNEQSTPQ